MNNSVKKYLGHHLLVDYYCCNEIINHCSTLEKELVTMIRYCGGTIVNATFHSFSPYGVTGVIIIAESHVAVHTWPEYQMACVDIFSCSEKLNMDKLVEGIGSIFGAEHYKRTANNRGKLNTTKTEFENLTAADLTSTTVF